MEGVELRSILTGKIYKVKRVNEKAVILEAAIGSNHVFTEMGNLNLFYEKITDKASGEESEQLLLPHLGRDNLFFLK
jgi:hypothetical protein